MTRSNNAWYTVYPKFTGITDLVYAKRMQTTENALYPYGRFDMTWEYVNVDPKEIVDVRLYRAIGEFGRYTNSRAETTQVKYEMIASWSTSDVTSYSDDLSDMHLNGVDESAYLEYATDILNVRRPIYYKIECVAKSASNGMCPMIFVCDGNHVAALSTKAQVIKDRFYGEADCVWASGFSGDPVDSDEVYVRISVDLCERRSDNRHRRVWATTNRGRVTCFDYWSGSVFFEYAEINKLPIYSMALNPIVGELLYHNGSRQLVSISYDEASASFNRVSYGSLFPEFSISDYARSTVGAVCTYEPTTANGSGEAGVVTPGASLPNHSVFFYSIVGNEIVAKIDVTNKRLASVLPRTHFGCAANTMPNQNNVYGISNGVGQAVWVNGHTPVHLYEHYVVDNGVKRRYRSKGLCRDYYAEYRNWIDEPNEVIIYGDPDASKNSKQYKLYKAALKEAGKKTDSWQAGTKLTSWCRLGAVDDSVKLGTNAKTRADYKAAFQAQHYKAYEMEWMDAHQEIETTVLTSLCSTDVPILQDIGYVYGCTSGVNYDVSNGQIEELGTNYREHIRGGANPFDYFSPITLPVSGRGVGSFWGESMQGVDGSVEKPYLSASWMQYPTLNTRPPSSQLGIAAAIPLSGSLSSEPHVVWQTNGQEDFVAKLDYNAFSYEMDVKPVPVYRFSYKQAGVENMYVARELERNNLAAGLDWRYYRTEFYAYRTSAIDTVPVYRYFGPTHLFTTNSSSPSGYVSEGIEFYAYASAAENTAPVYRFKSKTTSGHFLTINEAEKNNALSALSASWAYDGIAFHAYKQPAGSYSLSFPDYPSVSAFVDDDKIDSISKYDESRPTHIAVDDTNSIWVFGRGPAVSGVYKIKRNPLNDVYPCGLSAVYTSDVKLFGNANNNTSDVVEKALLCKYALSGYSAVSGGATFSHADAVSYLSAHEFPDEMTSLAYVYNKGAAVKRDHTGKYTKAVTGPVYRYQNPVPTSVDYEYNSNNTGIASVFTMGCVDLDPDYCHPEPTPPSGVLVISEVRQGTNTVCDEIDDPDFWNDKSFVSVNRLSGAGYDDLTTTHVLSSVSMGSYELVGTWWNYTDETEPVSSFERHVGDSLSYLDALWFEDPVYHWKTPNVLGTPLGSVTSAVNPLRQRQHYVHAGVITYKNVYEYSEELVLGYTNHYIGMNTVDVYERWPTPVVCAGGERCGASEDFWGTCDE